MDPFARNENYSQEGQYESGGPIIDLSNNLRDLIEAERPSKVEVGIENTTNVLGRSFKLIALGVGVVTICCLLLPYSRLLYEFAKWAFTEVGNIFP